MTNVEFLEVTQEIEKFYEKELTSEQSRIWFDEIRNLTKERYRQISREVYKSLKFMPKLADIIEINKTIPSVVKQDNTVYECSRCNGTGIVCYTQIKEGYPYEFGARCNCQNGMKLSKSIPSIDEVGLTL